VPPTEDLLLILKYICENEPTTIETIHEELGLQVRVIYRHLNNLTNNNLIKTTKESHKSPKIISFNWKYFLDTYDQSQKK